jgi:hypothetical protein
MKNEKLYNDMIALIEKNKSINVNLTNYDNLQVRLSKTKLHDSDNHNGVDGYDVSAIVVINDDGHKPMQYVSFSDIRLIDALRGFKEKLDSLSNL